VLAASLVVYLEFAVLTWAILLSHVGGALALQGPVSVYPTPGSRVAEPATQIVFRGIAPGSIGAVRVTGSRNGAHTGRIAADSDGQGGASCRPRASRPGRRSL